MKKILLATAASVCLGGTALAADLPTAPAPAPVVMPPVFTWTGFYAGVHAGAIWGETDVDFVSGTGLVPGYITGGRFPRSLSLDGNGFIGGGQLGYNAEIGRIVVGIEADLSYTSFDESAQYRNTVEILDLITARTEMDWFGSARARLGFAAGRFLPFVTGGIAFGHVESSLTVTQGSLGATLTTRASEDETLVGWTVGAGAEYAFTNNLLLKAEYLYYDLGDQSVTVPVGFAAGNATYDFEHQGHIARVGLNYKF